MQIELNDDQVALLMDLLNRTISDVKFYREEAETVGKDGERYGVNEVGLGYAGVAMYQTECRLLELQETIEEQSSLDWFMNQATQRMEGRKAEYDESSE